VLALAGGDPEARRRRGAELVAAYAAAADYVEGHPDEAAQLAGAAAFLKALGPIEAAARQADARPRPGEATEALRWHNQAIELYNELVL
jgi:ABC-type nitrate/sulfonate/bicarbonate transport system substrate-binding protein